MLDLLEGLIDQQLRELIRKDETLFKKLGDLLKLKDPEKVNAFIDETLIFRFGKLNLEFWALNLKSCDRIYQMKKPCIKLESNQILVEEFSA